MVVSKKDEYGMRSDEMNKKELHPAVKNIIKLLAQQAVDDLLSEDEKKVEQDAKIFSKALGKGLQ